jgi:hypothetical protein
MWVTCEHSDDKHYLRTWGYSVNARVSEERDPQNLTNAMQYRRL